MKKYTIHLNGDPSDRGNVWETLATTPQAAARSFCELHRHAPEDGDELRIIVRHEDGTITHVTVTACVEVSWFVGAHADLQ